MQNIVLIGSNIAHSWSPTLHNQLFHKYKLPYTYQLMPMEKEDVPEMLERMRSGGYRGANVTSPHKEVAFDMLDERSEVAERISAINTVIIDNGRAFGENTDVAGFRWSLKGEALLQKPFSAAVLGTGGAARAAVEVLLEYDCLQELTLYSRSVLKAVDLCSRWPDSRLHVQSIQEFQPASIVVHATPLGLPGQEGRLLEPKELQGVELLYDMIYHPAETSLMAAARGVNVRAVGGCKMFAAQAAASFRLWTGVAVEPHEVLPLLP